MVKNLLVNHMKKIEKDSRKEVDVVEIDKEEVRTYAGAVKTPKKDGEKTADTAGRKEDNMLVMKINKAWEERRKMVGLTMNNDRVLRERRNRIQLTEYSWKSRSIQWWNMLPMEQRKESDLKQLKGSLRTWISNNTRLKW